MKTIKRPEIKTIQIKTKSGRVIRLTVYRTPYGYVTIPE